MTNENPSKLEMVHRELDMVEFHPRGKSSAPTDVFPEIPKRWMIRIQHLKEAQTLTVKFVESLDARVEKNHRGVPESFDKLWRAWKVMVVISTASSLFTILLNLAMLVYLLYLRP